MEVLRQFQQKDMTLKFTIFATALLSFCSLPAFALDARLIERAVEQIQDGVYTDIDGILVYENNELVAEHYFNGFDKSQVHQTRSTFKSVTGLLAAIAFDQKLLSPDELLIPLVSQYLALADSAPDKAQIRVKHLLNMTSGLHCSEMPGTGPYHDEMVDNGPEPLKYSVSIPMAKTPGEVWQYCNANSFLLGVAISAALKRAQMPGIVEFAKTNLFEPLGMEGYSVYQSPEGFLYAQGNARFLPRDLAKLGMLVLNQGQWQGKQLISSQHLKAISNGVVETHWSWTEGLSEQPASKSRYAYQWFHSDFALGDKLVPVSHTWGNGGQFVFVVPSLHLVIVFTGSNYGDITKQKQAFEIMQKFLLPAAASSD